MRNVMGILALGAALVLPAGLMATSANAKEKPTIILVHGAFAESSSWNSVIERLERDGYSTIAAANPLRSVATDGASVSAVIRSVKGAVILVGHSYGGPVITEAANGNKNVKALVYVAGFMPDTGETAFSLSAKFPGSTLGTALAPVPLPGGGAHLYIQPAKFHLQFAADVSEEQARLMAATQRPVTEAALTEATGVAAWKTIPSYVIYGSEDRNIPAAVIRFMAERAKAEKVVAIDGASHALMVSHPDEVVSMIEDAATAE